MNNNVTATTWNILGKADDLHELPQYLPTRNDKIIKETPKCEADNKSTNL
jgi:hypothetical protein